MKKQKKVAKPVSQGQPSEAILRWAEGYIDGRMLELFNPLQHQVHRLDNDIRTASSNRSSSQMDMLTVLVMVLAYGAVQFIIRPAIEGKDQ